MTKTDKFEFKAKGKALPKKIGEGVGVWTDGIMLSSDNAPLCDYRLKEGEVYKITVERVSK